MLSILLRNGARALQLPEVLEEVIRRAARDCPSTPELTPQPHSCPCWLRPGRVDQVPAAGKSQKNKGVRSVSAQDDWEDAESSRAR